jgi:poly(3-hydroxybutyrate) depolymerase
MRNFFNNLPIALLLWSMFFSTTLIAQIEDLQVGTLTRKMLVYAPLDIEENRPLLISLHGMNQDIAYQQNMAKWETIAKTNNFVVVYPAGINNSWSLSGTRDTDFILAIIDEMADRYDIDRNRVYLSGFSMGGMFTYYAATRIADKIAAFAPVAGYLMGGPNTNSSRAVPIIHTHGTTDDVVVFSGVQTSLNAWIARNNCPTTPEIINPYPLGNTSTNVAKYTWGPGNDSVEVVLLRLTGVGHWHSTTHGGVNTSQEIWDFCKRFSLGFGIPEFTKASVSDSNPYQINVQFSKPMKDIETYNGFTVKIDGQDALIDSVSYGGSDELLIYLIDSILNTNEILLSYSNGNVLSIYDKKLVDFNDKIVDNLLYGASPRLVEVFSSENGDTLFAKFNKKMLYPTDFSAFSLDALYNGEMNIPLLECSFLDSESFILAFTIGEKVYADYKLTFSYTGNNIESVDNALLIPFSELQVTNNSAGIPTYVESGTLELNAYIITLSFSKSVALKRHQLAQLKFEVNGERIPVDEFTIQDKTIRFILSKNLRYGDSIKVNYIPGDIKARDNGSLLAFNLTVDNPLPSPTWHAIPGRIEAEDYTMQFGTATEATNDIGGGLNVNSIDTGDWLEYTIENNSLDTVFDISFRIAAAATGSWFEYFFNDKKIGIVVVPGTGGHQTWQTIFRKITLGKGKHYLKIAVLNGGFNINYIEFTQNTTNINESKNKDFIIYPNPASNHIVLESSDFLYNKVELIDMTGRVVQSKSLAPEPVLQIPVSLNDGIYLLKISNATESIFRRIIIKN